MKILGFDKYAENLDIYLRKIREILKTNEKGNEGIDIKSGKEKNDESESENEDEDNEDIEEEKQ